MTTENSRPLSVVDSGVSIADRLDASRKELLDLGLRNSLLNYRLLRARGVEVVEERSSEVFLQLVRQGKALSFLPAVDEQSTGELAQPEPVPPSRGESRRPDLRLQTSVPSVQLQDRLLSTYYAARSSIEEQGVNTLFLALGMLHWYEADDASTCRKAPLLLVPVQLDRSNARERFHLRYTGEEIGDNLSLREKLRADFAITLPPRAELEDLDVDAYLSQVRDAVQSLPAWTVASDEIALGFFSFAKLLMFKDLEAAAWPEDHQPSDRPLLRALLGEGFREPPPAYSDEENLDLRPEPADLHPVMDADSSQTLAILDVKSGRNLVIQGPPGTGKSQTIGNMIAEAVAGGQTVLFVSEKLAALEVVKRRLDSVGLGDACLELHSNKTQKKALLAELQRTLDLGRPRAVEPVGERELLEESRHRLNAYCEAINAPLQPGGVTPHEALGELVRMQQQHAPDALRRLEVPGMGGWDGAQFRRQRSLVEQLQARLDPCGLPREHPFWGSRRTVFLPTEAGRLRDQLEAACVAIDSLVGAGTALAAMHGAPAPVDRASILALFPSGWQFWRGWFGADRAARTGAAAALADHQSRIDGLIAFLQLDQRARWGAQQTLVDLRFTDQRSILDGWLQHLDTLTDLTAFNDLAAECHTAGLGPVVQVAETWPEASRYLVTALHYTWFSELLERAYAERRALAGFNRQSHEHALEQFRRIDGRLGHYNSTRLAHAHWEGLPSLVKGGGQLAVLKHEFEKKARHLPIRQLMIRAGRPIQAIKPVFMMSPLSIANYLPPGSLHFDLVIFDEASQVRPVDAFGALMRGSQAVVVGDARQLPPTSFFDALTRGEEVDSEESTTADIESVLGLFSSQLAPERMLRWHYRSRHESLIAVSNHAFYADRLVVFPSPDAGRETAGLRFHHLPHSAYERGTTRSNPTEAREVALAVMEHARRTPYLSLGVAAFSVAQMEAVQNQLELLRRQDDSCESFFSTASFEPFFVKNLETVQGDERDVIFISVGYGRTAEGYLSMSFGPLNGAGGERRLNVLITRARLRCEVFTNLTGDDILADGKGAGIAALKLFLTYAQTGRLDLPQVTGGEADSPFEEAVGAALVARGYRIERQVGSSGFRLDLAVVDPNQPGRYVLGIECDGATYHSARSARDRDRLRQAVLENLGWRIHRIWSTDWFRDPNRELQRVEDAIARASIRTPLPGDSIPAHPALGATNMEPSSSLGAVSSSALDELNDVQVLPESGRGRVPARSSAEPAVTREEQPHRDLQGETASPYRLATLSGVRQDRELHAIPPRQLAIWVQQVVAVESPVHSTEVARRIADAAGVRRIGTRIDGALTRAINLAIHSGTVRRQGDFLWSPSMREPSVRNRASLPTAARHPDLVAPEEVAEAIRRAVTDAYGMPSDQIPNAVCHLLGFARASEDLRRTVAERVSAMLDSGTLVEQNGDLTTTVFPPGRDGGRSGDHV